MQRLTMTVLVLATAAGCVGEIGGSGESGDDDGSGSGSDEPEPVVCEQARIYKNFGGDDLAASRPLIEPGSDRVRIKPYGALAAEYNRALGLTDVNTAAYAGTFGKPPARWFEEPQATAATVYAAFALAFDACSRKTATGGDFAAAPEPAIADRLCHDFARAAWNREASIEEAATCASFAVDKTKASDAPAKRWAYTCASVLTASDFLTY